jgi:hypothetical protein
MEKGGHGPSEVVDPELRISNRSPVLFQLRQRNPNVVEQRGPVDLVGERFNLELLDCRRGGSKCGAVFPDGITIETTQIGGPGNEPGGVRRRRIEMLKQIAVRLAQSVQLTHQEDGLAVTSE